MCTIMTVNFKLYTKLKSDILDRIYDDNRRNLDGLALVAIDPEDPTNDVVFKSFSVDAVVEQVVKFFDRCLSYDSRVFIHQRMATGYAIHVGTMHAFNDRDGNILMHNGIFSSASRAEYAVDSFAMVDMLPLAWSFDTLDALLRMEERFTNLFIIRPATMSYGVVRMASGSLYSDGDGNYSTNPIGNQIIIPVEAGYADEHDIGATTFKSQYQTAY